MPPHGYHLFSRQRGLGAILPARTPVYGQPEYLTADSITR